MDSLDANYFAVQRRGLTLIGFDVSQMQLKVRYPAWVALLILAAVSHNWPMLVKALVSAESMLRFLDGMAIFNQGTLATVKLVVCVYKRQRLSALLQRLHAAHLQQPARVNRSELHRLDRRISLLYRNAVYATILSCAVMPIVPMAWARWQGTAYEPLTPLDFDFWLDMHRPRYYWPVYVWGVCGTSSVALTVIALDSLFSWLLLSSVAQFAALKLKLRTLQRNFSQLPRCVAMHKACQNNCDELNDIYAEILLVQYTLSFIQLCCALYRFNNAGWSSDLPFRICFLVVVFAQVCAYCLAGDYLKQESASVATVIYECFDWSTLPPGRRRLLALMMLRAQQPVQLSGYLFNIDRPLLLWVLKTTSSFLAMLRTLDR